MPRRKVASNSSRTRVTRRALTESDAPGVPPVPVVHAQTGDTLTVLVDVENATNFYVVTWDEKATLIQSLVDQSAQVTLTSGTHRLSWSFRHSAPGWEHRLAVKVNNAAPTLLEQLSEAKKDPSFHTGFALVEVA